MPKFDKITKTKVTSPSRFKSGQERGSVNLLSYTKAIQAKTIESEEYWYQHVFNGGPVGNKSSYYMPYQRISMADYITSDIFAKSGTKDRDFIEEVDLDGDIDTTYDLNKSNNDVYRDFYLFILTLLDTLDDGETKVLASYIIKSGLDDQLMLFNIPIDLREYIEILRPEKVKFKEELEKLFSSKHVCYKSVNSFKVKLATLAISS